MILNHLKLLSIVAFRNVLRNPRRSLLTLLAIMVGIWSSVVLSALGRGIAEQMALDAILNFTGHIQIHAPGFTTDPALEQRLPLPDGKLRLELLDKRVKAYAVRIRVPAVVMSERESTAVTLLGIDPAPESKLSFLADSIVEGKYLDSAEDKTLIVGKKFLDLLQTRLGKRVVIMSEDANNKIADRGFRISGVFDAELEATEKTYVITGINTLQRMLKVPDEISEIVVLAEKRDAVPQLISDLQKAVPDYEVSPWTELQPLIGAMMDLQGGFLFIWFFIVMITIAFGLINTLFMAIFERTREIGLIQALGMNARLVLLQVLMESFILLLIGTVLGNLMGWGSLYLLRDGIDVSVFASATAQYGMRNLIHPFFYLEDWIVANLMILVLGLLGSLYPAWKASRYTPVVALSSNTTVC